MKPDKFEEVPFKHPEWVNAKTHGLSKNKKVPYFSFEELLSIPGAADYRSGILEDIRARKKQFGYIEICRRCKKKCKIVKTTHMTYFQCNAFIKENKNEL